jgi:hypothetical protein
MDDPHAVCSITMRPRMAAIDDQEYDRPAARHRCGVARMARMSNMDVGDEWIYRQRPHMRSERVRIIGIEKRKQTTRVDIEFLDGDKAGVCENVPGTSLPRPWNEVAVYDELMAYWKRLDQEALDDTEDWAVTEVFDLLIPEDVAAYDRSCVRHGASVYSSEALESIMRRPMIDVLEHLEWFAHDGITELSAKGSVLVAEYACAANPPLVLDKVMASEAEAREHCKRGREYKGIDGEKRTSTPEWEYEWYRQRIRPYHEILRQWCGHRSVTFAERLAAAEAEVRRLDILVARLIDVVRENNPLQAQIFEQEHDNERICAETIRPVVDRPLAPWEMPVVEVPARRRGRWW